MDDAASDLRTFLIADVRGYTRYSQSFGDQAAADLARRFEQLASEGVASRGGRVVELRGDQALAVFGSARAAVRAAVELQRLFRSGGLGGEALPLGVGIGVDAGEGVALGDGYRGRALNVAARLCSAAQAGEILATETVERLAGRVEDASYARSKPLIVKGLDEPVRVCRVISTAPLPPVPRPLGRKKRGRPLSVAVFGAIGLAIVIGFVVATRGGSGVPSVNVVPNSVAVIDPGTDRLVADVPVGNAPASVVGGAGYVWVVNGINGTISRIDPRSRAIAGPAFSVGVRPSTLAVGAGSLWVGSLSDQAVVRVDPDEEAQVARFHLPEPPIGVAFAAGRLYAEGGNIYRIDPASGKVLSRALGVDPGAGAWPMAPIIAADDAVWAAIYAKVIEFDPRTLTEITELPGPALHGGVAVGGGAVWVPDIRDHTVWRIDPRVGGFSHTFEVGRQPTGVAFGAGGAWVSVSDGTVDRLDPVSGARTTIQVGRTPTSIVVAYGLVWVTVS